MKNINRFSKTVNSYWQKQSGTERVFVNAYFEIFVNEDLDKDYQLIVLEFSENINRVIMRLDLLEVLDKEAIQGLNFLQFKNFLEKQGIVLHGADNVFYFSEKEKTRIKTLEFPENIRALTSSDADSYAKFKSSVTGQDFDDAAVEIDHWKVFGFFDDNKLVAVSSVYPWDDYSKLGDMGVLTLPDYRGKGCAKKLIEIAGKIALQEGYEPQYRCQLDNTASVGLAKKLKLELFALWDVSITE